MTTWKTGRRLVAERLTARAIPLDEFIAIVDAMQPVRVPGTAVFMTAQPTGTPPALAHNLRYNKVLHERVVMLTVDDGAAAARARRRSACRSSRSATACSTCACSTGSWRIRTCRDALHAGARAGPDVRSRRR